MIDIEPRIALAFPEGQRYSCQRCGWCCKRWSIAVTLSERASLLAHDWAVENPRLRGVKLFEEQASPDGREPLIFTAHVGGQCVFLEEDGLCLIHKTLGPTAKPSGCRRFPARIGSAPEGVLIGADYACPSVIRNQGEPFRALVKRLSESEPDALSLDGVRGSRAEPRLLLAPGLPISWGAYLMLEGSILEILGTVGYPVTTRMGGAGELISSMADVGAARGGMDERTARGWLAGEGGDGYSRTFLRGAPSRTGVLRPAAGIAHLIGDVETPHSSTSGRGSAAIGYALAVAAGEGQLSLSTLSATVDLRLVAEATCDLDADEFGDCLGRFLENYVLRKSLAEAPDLKAGWEYLATCLSLIQWYARVAAWLGGRTRANLDDLVTGIQVVEKAYVA